MIVDTGKVQLLSDQLAALATYQWILYDNDPTLSNATILSNLNQPVWTGYAPVTVGALGTPVIVGGRAQTIPTTFPSWTNSSGADQTFFGWGLVAVSGTVLIAATRLGPTVIPDGLTFQLSAGITDTQQ